MRFLSVHTKVVATIHTGLNRQPNIDEPHKISFTDTVLSESSNAKKLTAIAKLLLLPRHAFPTSTSLTNRMLSAQEIILIDYFFLSILMDGDL